MRKPAVRNLICLFITINLLLLGRVVYFRTAVRELKVTFLDVGQGDAAVIETPSGRAVIIDTGGISLDGAHDKGRTTIEPFLRHEGIDHIDAIVLTHPHADHIGGADTLIDDFPTDMLVDNGEPSQPPIEERILADADRRRVLHRAALRGQKMDLGDGVKAEILAPTAQEAADDKPNNASVVVRLTYGKTVFLFMGDAEKAEEADLLASRTDLRCSVLKVGHHGSDTSSTSALLEKSRPQEAVVSVGENNRYGHPSGFVLERLRAIGAHVDRTDQEGAVTCISNGESVRVHSMRSGAQALSFPPSR